MIWEGLRHSDPAQPNSDSLMKTRAAQSLLQACIERSTVTMIVGPRQCGKSTLALDLQSIDGKWSYDSFDNPLSLQFALENPLGYLTEHRAPLILDEIQRCPSLLAPLKLFVDRDRTSGRYLLTGSANILALPTVNESLAGRMEILDLLPLSQAEISGQYHHNFVAFLTQHSFRQYKDSDGLPLSERIITGGFPEPALTRSPSNRRAWHLSYLRSILDRDVKEIARVTGTESLPKLISLIATKSGQFLNVASLARESRIKETTLHRYLEVLRRLFLIQELPSHQTLLVDRLLKSPKTYVVDTGLACALIGCDSARLQQDELLLASMTDAFVANELARLISGLESKPLLSHFRTVKQYAVPFVLEFPDGSLIGIDVTPSRAIASHQTEGLKYLKDVSGGQFQLGVVLYAGFESMPLAQNIWALPLSALWNPSLFFSGSL